MNRDFLIEQMTPAIARKIISVMKITSCYVDPKLLDMANDDLIETTHTGTIKELIQFISDHDRRCVIPYDEKVKDIRIAIASSIPDDKRVLFFDDPVNWNILLGEPLVPFRSENENRFQFLAPHSPVMFAADDIRALLANRDMMIVGRVSDASHFEWIGRAFKEIIFYCENRHQFGMPFRKEFHNSAHSLAAILYPHLTTMYGRLNSLPPEKTYALIGATDLFLRKEEKK